MEKVTVKVIKFDKARCLTKHLDKDVLSLQLMQLFV